MMNLYVTIKFGIPMLAFKKLALKIPR